MRATAEAALAVAALGPLAVAAGAIGLVAILMIRRRRAAIVLERGRGASGRQLLGAQLVEGLLVTIPAALVGLAFALVLVPVRTNRLSSTGAILVALAATAILVLTTWPRDGRGARSNVTTRPAAASRPDGSSSRSSSSGSRSPARGCCASVG